MNILWFSWKDIRHPEAGGAETVSNEIMRRLVKDGHSVKLITSRYQGSGTHKIHDGIDVYYTGGRFTVYLMARSLYKKTLHGWDDLVIDEMNTIPFLAAGYVTSKKHVLLAYQLAREVWFHQMAFPLSVIGYYLLEPLLLLIASKLYPIAITESQSSRLDMRRVGFRKVKIFKVGMAMKPLQRLAKKSDKNLVLSLGSVRPMKRTLDAVKAFEYARDLKPKLHMVIAGDATSAYGLKVIRYAEHSRHKDAIEIVGRVPSAERMRLMQSAGVIVVTSIKEGWGLIVTEANSQGTPAVVYDVDGLRDSVQNEVTGLVIQNNMPDRMGEAIAQLLNDPQRYDSMRKDAWESSKTYTFDNSYREFLNATGVIDEENTTNT